MLAGLARMLAPGGLLSLLVRNADALAMRPGLAGDWAAALAAFDTRHVHQPARAAGAGRPAGALTATLAGIARAAARLVRGAGLHRQRPGRGRAAGRRRSWSGCWPRRTGRGARSRTAGWRRCCTCAGYAAERGRPSCRGGSPRRVRGSARHGAAPRRRDPEGDEAASAARTLPIAVDSGHCAANAPCRGARDAAGWTHRSTAGVDAGDRCRLRGCPVRRVHRLAEATARRGRARAAERPGGRLPEVIRNVLPSVVQIDAGDGLGSGIVYDNKGHIVTNAHVVGDEKSFEVTVATGEQVLTARLVVLLSRSRTWRSSSSTTVPDGLKPAKFGDSAKVEVGQIVLAMGSPLGLSSSVTQGIVSAVGRTVSESRPSGGTGRDASPTWCRPRRRSTRATAAARWSTWTARSSASRRWRRWTRSWAAARRPGIGFAIPVSMVKTVADQIIKDGKVTDSGRAALGITGRTVARRRTTSRPGSRSVERAAGRGGAEGRACEPGTSSPSWATRRDHDDHVAVGGAGVATKPGEKVDGDVPARAATQRPAEVTLGEM